MPLHKSSRHPNHNPSPHGQTQNDSDRTWVFRLRSVKATEDLGRAIGRQLGGGEFIALIGELGAGKTVLVRGIATGIGISSDQVTSPTFTLLHEYSGRLHLVHADLYRINNLEDLRSIGLEDYYSPSSAVVIEWADRMGPEMPEDYLRIHLTHGQRHTRLATIKAHGPASHTLLQRLITTLGKNIEYRTRNVEL